MRGGPPEAASALPDRPLERWGRRLVQPAQPPANPRDSGVARADLRARRARPARGLPQPGARAAAEPPSRGPLGVCPQRLAPAVYVLAWRTPGVGKIFFPLPGLGGSRGARGRGEWWEPQGASGPQGAAGERRAEGRREPVAFPKHLGAGSASRRLAGTCLLDEPAREAPEVPGSSGALPALPGFSLRAPVRAGAPMTGRKELCLRWHPCGCEMGMSVYLCVSMSLGLCRVTVSFSETHLATVHRPEPPRCSGGTVMTSVAGLCLCALGKENRCFGVCDPPQAPRLFWQSPGDSRGGGCQFCLGGF